MRASERAIEQAIEPIREYARTLRRGDYPTIDEAAEAIKRAERIEARADELQSLLDTPPDPDGEISVKLTRDEVSALARATAWMPGVLYRDHIQHWDSGLAKLKAVLENPDA